METTVNSAQDKKSTKDQAMNCPALMVFQSEQLEKQYEAYDKACEEMKKHVELSEKIPVSFKEYGYETLYGALPRVSENYCYTPYPEQLSSTRQTSLLTEKMTIEKTNSLDLKDVHKRHDSIMNSPSYLKKDEDEEMVEKEKKSLSLIEEEPKEVVKKVVKSSILTEQLFMNRGGSEETSCCSNDGEEYVDMEVMGLFRFATIYEEE